MRELWNRELDANAREALEEVNIVSRSESLVNQLGSDLRMSNRFYSEIQKLKCKVPCTGQPMMRQLASVCQGSDVCIVYSLPFKGRSKFGKTYFVGCSAWKYTERDKHRYLPIPSNIDEDILLKVMANDGVLPPNIASNTNTVCVLAVHPRIALKACRE
jgi:hypothetical protein